MKKVFKEFNEFNIFIELLYLEKIFVSPSFMIQNSSKNTFEKEINNFKVFNWGRI